MNINYFIYTILKIKLNILIYQINNIKNITNLNTIIQPFSVQNDINFLINFSGNQFNIINIFHKYIK